MDNVPEELNIVVYTRGKLGDRELKHGKRKELKQSA